MKQGNKIVSYIVLLSIVFVMILTASLFGLFNVAFKTVEKHVACKNLQFCINSLQTELKHLNGLVYEWAAWDDAGRFIEGNYPEFIEQNTGEELLREKQFDVICFLNREGNILWLRTVKNTGNESRTITLEMFSQENLQKNQALWNHKNPGDCAQGFFATEGGVLMLSSRPVTNDTDTLPIRGTVMFGRFINDRTINSIAKQTCLDFKWWNLHSNYTRQAMEKTISQITPDNPVYIEFELNSAAAYTILQDINKNDAVLVKFLMTGELAAYRDKLMIKSAGVFFVEGVIFLVCLAVSINSLCRKQFPQPAQNTEPVPDTEYLSFEQMSEIENSNEDAVLIEEDSK